MLFIIGRPVSNDNINRIKGNYLSNAYTIYKKSKQFL